MGILRWWRRRQGSTAWNDSDHSTEGKGIDAEIQSDPTMRGMYRLGKD